MERIGRGVMLRRAAIAGAVGLFASSLAWGDVIHRYSFSPGSELLDSVGTAHLTNAGGVTVSGGRAIFPGAANNTGNSYLVAPAGILPTGAADSVSIEVWGAYDSTTGIASRIFDFGNSFDDFLYFTPRTFGENTEVAIRRGGGGVENLLIGGTFMLSGAASVDRHAAVVFDNAADELRLYVDGILLGTRANTLHTLESMAQGQNFIGRSKLNQPQLKGSIDELRIDNTALSSQDVLLRYALGPAQYTFDTYNFVVASGNVADNASWNVAAPGPGDRGVIANAGIATASGAVDIGQIQLIEGTLQLDIGATVNLPGGIHLSPASAQSAAVEIASGATLSVPTILTSGDGSRQLSIDGGTLALTNTVVTSINVPLSLGANGATLASDEFVNWAGVIAGTGGLIKQGSGELRFNAANTYQGDLDVQTGGISIHFNAAATLGDATGKTILRSSTYFRYNGVGGAGGLNPLGESFQLDGGRIEIGANTTVTLNGNIEVSADTSELRADPGSRYIVNGNIVPIGGDRQFALAATSANNNILNGQLNLGPAGTLVRSGGGAWALTSDANVFGTVAIDPGSTLRIGDNTTTGNLPADVVLLNGSTAVLQLHRQGSLTVAADIQGTGSVQHTASGNTTLIGSNTYTGSTTVSAGKLTVVPGAVPDGNIVTVSGAEYEMVGSSSAFRLGNLTVNTGGVVTLSPRTSPPSVLYVTALNMAPDARLDLNDNDLLVDYTDASPYLELQQWVLDGYRSSPDLSATGIVSSTSQAQGGDTLLVLLDNAIVGGAITEWLGQPIDADTVIGKYTYFGDANLDGQVTGDDFALVVSNLGMTDNAHWIFGDMNFDGQVTGDDVALVVANLGKGVGNPLGSSFTPVPEPAITALGALALLLRRTRRRK